MAWGESKAWLRGTASGKLYQALLDDALDQPVRNAKRKKIVHPEEMPWEMSRQCLYVVEGRGYDLHQDCDVEITDTYHWKPQDEVKRYEWEAGDVIYIPPNTIHQHFNADPQRPARLISATNRIYKYCGLNDLEQLEDAPEYDSKVVLDADLIKQYLAGKVKEPA